MNLKKQLAFELVSQLHGREAAAQAEKEFTNVFQKRETPEEVNEYAVSFREFRAEKAGIDIGKLLAATNQVNSRSEANRLISQGAISIEGLKITTAISPLNSGDIIKVGKHRFVKYIDSNK